MTAIKSGMIVVAVVAGASLEDAVEVSREAAAIIFKDVAVAVDLTATDAVAVAVIVVVAAVTGGAGIAEVGAAEGLTGEMIIVRGMSLQLPESRFR